MTLVPRKAFALTKVIQLRVSGLEESCGRLIDGDHDGGPGGDAVGVIGRGGVSVNAVPALGPLILGARGRRR